MLSQEDIDAIVGIGILIFLFMGISWAKKYGKIKGTFDEHAFAQLVLTRLSGQYPQLTQEHLDLFSDLSVQWMMDHAPKGRGGYQHTEPSNPERLSYLENELAKEGLPLSKELIQKIFEVEDEYTATML